MSAEEVKLPEARDQTETATLRERASSTGSFSELHTSPPSRVPAWFLEGQPARICFIAALVAFTAAAAGWMVNVFLSGWMEVAGMLAVGLFYLGLGLLEVGRRSPTESGP